MTAVDGGALRRSVEAAITEHDIDAVGVTTVDDFPDVRQSIEARKAAGHHAGMSFTFKNPRRSTEPRRLLRNAASLVVAAKGYLEPTPPHPSGATARVARYAWRDYYAELRLGLDAGAAVLRDAGHRAVVVADQNGLVDRAAAHRAGIGWWGRNANLLVPGAGSWFVLGSIVTDAVLPPATEVVEDGCRTCMRCIDGCPTGAISDRGVIDARRCLAWLVQDVGVFPRAYRVALGDRLYGCDDCQDVCPPGRRSVGGTEIAVELSTTRPAPDAWVDVLAVLAATDADLLDRFGRWYIPQRAPRYLRRNALVVLGNVGSAHDPAVRSALDAALVDPDELIRAHAVWACARLGLHDRWATRRDDPSAMVRAEVAMAPTVDRESGASPARMTR